MSIGDPMFPSAEEVSHWNEIHKVFDAIEARADDVVAHRLREEVRNQSHYDFPIKLIDFLEAVLTPEEFRGHLRSCILKYVVRFPHKDGLKDLAKAEDYMERLIKHEGKKSGI